MTFCTITPDRGDRPKLMEFCKHQISRMIVKPDHSYFIDYPPVGPEKDLIERVRKGIQMARADGFDYAFIVESDDFYPADYFYRMSFHTDFIGDNRTWYYHLRNNGYSTELHPGHSSLFTTGFRLSALDGFDFRQTRKVFLDVSLWKHSHRRRLTRSFISSGCVGIKHGIGVTGGIGHRERIYKKFDKDWSILAGLVDKEALDFYMGLQKEL